MIIESTINVLNKCLSRFGYDNCCNMLRTYEDEYIYIYISYIIEMSRRMENIKEQSLKDKLW